MSKRTSIIKALSDKFNEIDGQAPYTIWRKAIDSGLFKDLGVVRTLGLLQRV